MNRTLTALCLAAALAFAGTASAGEKLAEQHIAKGLQCQTCHGPDMKNPQMPEMATCTGCHNVDQLVEKTKNVKPVNPHVSPHYGKTLECTPLDASGKRKLLQSVPRIQFQSALIEA